MNDSTLSESLVRNIPPAAAKQETEAERAAREYRLASKRLAAGPEGTAVIEGLERLSEFVKCYSERIAEREAIDAHERKWLMTAKGRRLTLDRLIKATWRNRALNQKQRARRLKAFHKAEEELWHWTREAKAEIATCRAEINRAKWTIRDLLVVHALAYQSAYPGQRVPSYANMRAAVWTIEARSLLPKTPISKLVSLAKAEVARSGGAVRWAFAAEILRSLAEPAETIEPEIP